MRILLLFLLLFLFSCSEENPVAPEVTDSLKIMSIPTQRIYVDTNSVDTLLLVLSSTQPLNLTSLTVEVTTKDTLKHHTDVVDFPSEAVTVTLPLALEPVFEDTIQIPVAVSALPDTITDNYNLIFYFSYGAIEKKRSVRLDVRPEPATISINGFTPKKDTLVLLEVDTFVAVVEASDILAPADFSLGVRKPNGESVTADVFDLSILEFLPDTLVECSVVVTLKDTVALQGDYKLYLTGNYTDSKSQSASDVDSMLIYIEARDSLVVSELLLEADSVSPGGQLEGTFYVEANKKMQKSDVSYYFTNELLQPVTTISGYTHSFNPTFKGELDFDINVGATTPVGTYTYHIVVTNDSLSDTLSGLLVVADGIVERLSILSTIPDALLMHPGVGYTKVHFTISSSKIISSSNCDFTLFQKIEDTLLSQKDKLETYTYSLANVNGLYEVDLLLKSNESMPVGTYDLTFTCELDSAKASVTIPLSVENLVLTFGDIPTQTIKPGETKVVTTTVTSNSLFDVSDFSSTVEGFNGSIPNVEFVSYSGGLLTMNVTVPVGAKATSAYIKVGIEDYTEGFTVKIPQG